MKKSGKIQLVLITAALASCHRELIPSQSFTRNTADSTLTAPAPGADPYYSTFNVCCQEAYSQLWNYSFNPLSTFYFGPIGPSYYYPGGLYRKGAFWRSNHFIVRGGLGKSSSSAS
jgi:hypothetical protein